MTFKIRHPQADAALTYRRTIASGVAASIGRGTPTKEVSAGTIAIMVDGDGTTSQRFSGIAKSVSTDTVAAAGEVVCYIPFPGVIYEGKPKTSGSANSQSEIDALMAKRTVFDLTSSVWTIDGAAGDGATNGVVIVGGQPEEDVLFFVMSPTVTNFE